MIKLNSILNSNMVSKPLKDLLGNLLPPAGPPAIYIYASSSIVLGVRGCRLVVKFLDCAEFEPCKIANLVCAGLFSPLHISNHTYHIEKSMYSQQI
jgi:hypothetical protein